LKTNTSQCRCVHHKSVPLPLCSPQICPSAAVFTTNLSQCRSVHHKSVPVPLYSPQICPSAAVFTTNLSQCRCVHHKSVPVPLSSPQISHGLEWDRVRASAVSGGRLTVCRLHRTLRSGILNSENFWAGKELSCFIMGQS
jgi:hypothetical protein